MEVYDKIWEDYVDLYDKFTFDIQDELLSFVAQSSYGRVVDAGCGVGKLFPYLFLNPYVKEVLGVEKSDLMKRKSDEKILGQNERVQVVGGDVCLLSDVLLDVDFEPDVICSINVVHSLDNPELFFEESFKALKKGGALIISAPNKNVDFNGKIYPHISSGFEGEDVERDSFNRYVEINKVLVDSDSSIAFLYSLDEVKKVLEKVGFKVIFASDYFYLGCNFIVIARKF